MKQIFLTAIVASSNAYPAHAEDILFSYNTELI